MSVQPKLENIKTSDYKEIKLEETLQLLDSSAEGLTELKAGYRLKIFGYNEVTEKNVNQVLSFFKRYWGPMPWLLEFAAILSYAIGHLIDAIVIVVLLTINAVIGFRHSRSAGKALELLKKKLAIKVKLLRDGKWVTKEARELVPGDVLVLGLGDVIPADAKVIEGELSVDQSALTGESLPVEVGPSDVVYSGSIVRQGDAKVVAVNTGLKTYFGRTTELVKIAKPRSHQEDIMMAIVRYMMYLGIGAIVLVALYSAAFQAQVGIIPIVTFAVILLMAAIPVALPAVLTIAQAVTALELTRKGALVTRLDSVEDAASIDILYLDKTGTVTQNSLEVTDAIAFSGFSKKDVALAGAEASKEEGKDLIDLAVIAFANKIAGGYDHFKQMTYTPFHPSTKRAEAVIEEEDGRIFRVVKGAPQVIISICHGLSDVDRDSVIKTVEELSTKGYRTLGVARSQEDNAEAFQFIGLLSLSDPPRPDSKEMIDEVKALGMRPIMLTGDNVAIAKEIAQNTGFGSSILRLSDIRDLSEDEQVKRIEKVDGIAEIYPEDKYRIVKLSQSRGSQVGMTGDGVNDAPSLKQAEMGIAVSNATDVAKASAAVVLTEPGLRVIVDVIRESRKTYERMLTWVLNKITKVIQVIVVLTVGFFWVHNLVLTLLGMVLLIFANDFATMSISTDRVESALKPRSWGMKNITLSSAVIGVLFVVQSIIIMFITRQYLGISILQLQTVVALNLIFNSQFRVLIVRERRHFWSSLPGKALMLSVLATVAAFVFIGIFGIDLVTPLDPYIVLFVLAYSALFTLAIDFPKYITFKKFGLTPETVITSNKSLNRL